MALFLIEILFLVSFFYRISPALLGIDISEDSFKVSSIAHGKGVEIMLDAQSKRKIPSLIFFDKNERHYGNQATNFVQKTPKNSISHFKSLLGFQGNSEITISHRKENYIFSSLSQSSSVDEHNTSSKDKNSYRLNFVVGLREGHQNISPEEALAMFLRKLCTFALEKYGFVIKEAAFTVPSYFTQNQRRAVLKAAEIADLKVLSLIGGNMAAALQYSLKFEGDKKNVVIMDIGFSKTEVTLIKFASESLTAKEKRKSITELENVFDESIGGRDFDKVLVHFLFDAFSEKHNYSQKERELMAQDERLMHKLRFHAEKVKKVLSSNKETFITIENLFEGKDFMKMVKREDFERISKDLVEKTIKLLKGISGEYEEIVLIGGSSRIPLLQTKIAEFTNKKISKILNPDEAPVLGAAMRAANISSAFRVSKTNLYQRNAHTIEILLSDVPLMHRLEKEGLNEEFKDPSDDSIHSFSKSAILFKTSDFLGKKRIVSLKRKSDFYGRVIYRRQSLPENQNALIFEFKTKGVKKFFEESGGNDLPKISFLFKLSEDGLVGISKVWASLDAQKGVEKIDKNETIESEKETVKQNGNEKEIEHQRDNQKTENEEKLEKPKKLNEKYSKNVIDIVYLKGLEKNGELINQKEINKSKELLKEYDDRDEETIAAAKKLNTLEEFLYQFLELSSSKFFGEVSTDKEKIEIKASYENVSNWLTKNRDENQQKAEEYEIKLNEFKANTFSVINRFNERYQLPKAVEYAQQVLDAVKEVINQTIHNKTWISIEEITEFTNQTKKFIDWLNQKVKENEKLPKTADPVLLSENIVKRVDEIKKRAHEFVLREKVEVPPTGHSPEKENKTAFNTTRKRRVRKRVRFAKEEKNGFFSDLLNKTKRIFTKTKKMKGAESEEEGEEIIKQVNITDEKDIEKIEL